MAIFPFINFANTGIGIVYNSKGLSSDEEAIACSIGLKGNLNSEGERVSVGVVCAFAKCGSCL